MNTESETPDPREFLEQFRQSLRVKTPDTEAEMPRLLATYSQLCEDANRRLRDCFALIQRGQYSDAVQLAEHEPNLLDRCALLEIPERDMLVPGAQLIEAKPPTLINRDLVAAVQDSYQKDSTSAGNRSVLHRLTLARAPLPARLSIMRRMLVQNPNHPFMQNDIRTFERAWFKQAGPLAQSLLKDGRSELIAEVLEDLQQGGYVEGPPSSLISQLRALIAKAEASAIPALAEEIKRAFAERSIPTLAHLAERWRSQVGRAGLANSEASFGVAEAFDWLASTHEQDRKSDELIAARSRLEQAIRAPGTNRFDLEIAYRTAKGLGAVDAALEGHFRSRLAAIDGARRMLVMGIAIAASLIVISSIVGAAWIAWGRTAGDPGNSTASGGPVIPKNRDDPLADTRAADKNGPGSASPKPVDKPDKVDVLGNRLVDFRKQMEGATAANGSLESLAKFLEDEVAPNAPDRDQARAAKQAKDALPTWKKALTVGHLLQSGEFLNHPLDDTDWKGQPPSETLAAAAEYAEMLRNRDSSIEGTESAKLKARLGRMDIVNLYVIRRAGEDTRYYTKNKPAGGDQKERVQVLLDSIGREEEVPFLGKRTVQRAAQSVFAEQAAKLWDLPKSANWIQNLADTYESLLSASDMDPMLKLDLVRKFLSLAVRTSAGYSETLGEMAEFKDLTGQAGVITGNWLDAGETLDNERARAAELNKKAPHLLRLVPLATTREEQRLATLKHGLVAAGWISLDGSNHPTLVKFGGTSPAGGSRLFAVGDGGWIDLGGVLDDGNAIRLSDAAAKYVGWPVFALASPR